jgi:hypothetical protein
MSTSNGRRTVVPTQEGTDESADRYRPIADRDKVYREMEQSLGRIVQEASHQAGQFASLASYYDRKETIAVRYGHLVDASECLELAMTYLNLLKSVLSYEMRVEDDQYLGDPAF